MGNLEKAFHRIVGILEAKDISFQIAGGLAARIYGSTRPLEDIDIYIPMELFPFFREDVGDHLTWGSEHYKDDVWDIVFMKIVYASQKIELADAATTQLFDRRRKRWMHQDIDFRKSTRMTCFGRDVPVIPRGKLIEYKRILDRDFDRKDISEIRRAG
jgi:hypothetical protein